MPPGHCDRQCASLKALRDNLKLLLRRPGAAALAARDHLDPLAVATSTINRRSILWVVVLFRHHLRPPLCGRDGMLQHQPDRVSPPGRLRWSSRIRRQRKQIACILSDTLSLTLTAALWLEAECESGG